MSEQEKLFGPSDPNWFEPDEDCPECGGEGFVLRDCFEDTCCCADPETQHGYKRCPMCGGNA